MNLIIRPLIVVICIQLLNDRHGMSSCCSKTTPSACCGVKEKPIAASSTVQEPRADISSCDGIATTELNAEETRKNVQEYYGKTLQASSDLKTNACCTGIAQPPLYIRKCLNNIHSEVLTKFYGCGLCVPKYDITGCHVLDLGCGAGRDVYIASQLVGNTGKVVGIDMTIEQLEVARKHQKYHAEVFGYDNVEFVHGYLEKLGEVEDLKEGTFDLIISNCVINLCTDKESVLKACYRLLKPGGELYFSDAYASRRVPIQLQKDPVLWGECLSGALYWNDFNNIAKRCGFADPRLVEDAPITINNPKVSKMFDETGNGNIEFYSATYRLQKTDDLEPSNEDYGQAVIYKGTIIPGYQAPAAATSWTLDKHHVFEAGKIESVCGNTWKILLNNPRLRPHFEFIGNFEKHYGVFKATSCNSFPYTRTAFGTNKVFGCC